MLFIHRSHSWLRSLPVRTAVQVARPQRSEDEPTWAAARRSAADPGLPAGLHEDGAVGITEGNRTPGLLRRQSAADYERLNNRVGRMGRPRRLAISGVLCTQRAPTTALDSTAGLRGRSAVLSAAASVARVRVGLAAMLTSTRTVPAWLPSLGRALDGGFGHRRSAKPGLRVAGPSHAALTARCDYALAAGFSRAGSPPRLRLGCQGPMR